MEEIKIKLSALWVALMLTYLLGDVRDIVKCCGSHLSGGVDRWGLSE
jgi:hypothetical protein